PRGQHPQLSVLGHRPVRAVGRCRLVAPVGTALGGTGRTHPRAPAHRCPTASGPVPARARGGGWAVARVVGRPGAVRPRCAHRRPPDPGGVHRPGWWVDDDRPRGGKTLRPPPLHGTDQCLHRTAAVHRPTWSYRDRSGGPGAAGRRREGGRATPAVARRADLGRHLGGLAPSTLLRRTGRGRGW